VTHTLRKTHGHQAGQQVQSIFMNESKTRHWSVALVVFIEFIVFVVIAATVTPCRAEGAKGGGAGAFNLSKCIANVYLINEMNYCTSICLCVCIPLLFFLYLYKQADTSTEWMKQQQKPGPNTIITTIDMTSINAAQYVGRN